MAMTNNKKLTDKQALFVEEYLQDFNATRAAERAGYSGDENSLAVQGHRLLRNAKIAERVRLRLQEAAMTANEVLSRLAAIARSSYSEYLTSDATVDFGRLIADGQGFLVKAIKDTRYGKQIEFYDAQRALELIGKRYGLFVERHAIVDWRTEASERGLDASELFERMVQEAAAAIETGDRGHGSGGMDGGT